MPGKLRVAERQGVGQWTVHQWIKKAVLLSFRLNDNQPMHAGGLQFFDKVEPKFAHLDEAELRATGVRIVPPAVARHGSFIGRNAVLMPSYVNIGAYVDEGTMVDTWVTVGQYLVAAFVAEEVIDRRAARLQHRAHGPVGDHDSLGHDLQQRGHSVAHLPPF